MSALDKFTEAVAAAQREADVAKALLREHKHKLRMAEEEVQISQRRLEQTQADLSEAAVKLHEAVHGKPVSIDDRFEFERRWDARFKEHQERLERMNNSLLPLSHPDNPNHVHEDCCK